MLGLAGKGSLVCREVGALNQDAVTWDPVASLKLDKITDDELLSGNSGRHAIVASKNRDIVLGSP